MKGDFSRIRFNSARLYTAVLKQQGRVDLDSDANEQCAIDVTLRQTTNADIIGPCGGPINGAGFAISIDGDDIWISAGRYYVAGILVEIPYRVHYNRQPYLFDPAQHSKDLLEDLIQAGEGASLQFQLEVWQRMATALDDPCLLEPALNQADTTTRLQTIWRVVGTILQSRLSSFGAHTGQMGASTPGEGSGCGCQPIPAAGYQGMENQLYRVEIHQPGDLTTATFKWSRENGSVVTQVTDVNGPTVTVSTLGPDANLGFQPGQWVELSDDTNQFAVPAPNQPGTLYQIFSIDHTALQVTMTIPVTGLHKNRNARMRRWDQSGASATASAIPVSSSPVPLENGIQVNFSKGQFQSGDYWTIPARTANGSIDWPPCGSDGKHFQTSSYIAVNQAPLACASRVSIKIDNLIELRTVVFDQRSLFPALATKAIHIEDISWSNADLQTLDQFISNGLNLTLDVAPTSTLDAAVFRVSLEIAGSGFFRQGLTDNAAAKPAIANKPRGLTPAASSTAAMKSTGMRIGPALRQEYVLDGLVKLTGPRTSGWLLNWIIPTGFNQGGLVYNLNTLLVNAYESAINADGVWSGIPAARVRVQLFGRAIFAEASSGCGPLKTIFLDGQCFGSSGQLSDGSTGIALQEPSGSGVLASDFESWFYLAPAPEVEYLSFDPSVLTLAVGSAKTSANSSSGTSTGTVQMATPVSSAVTVNLTANTLTGLTLTLSSNSIVIAAGSSSQTFTATVEATTEAANGQVTFTVTATPQLETPEISSIFSSSGELYVTVENPLAIATASLPNGTVGKAYPTIILLATGGVPPYTWSLASGYGALPAGLTLSVEGTLSGTPETAGDFSITVHVADSASPNAAATKQFTIDVAAALEITTKSPLPQGFQGSDYRTQFEATGGKTPYKWKVSAGKLPEDLSLSTAGEISGTLAVSGKSEMTIEVTDSANPANEALRNFTIDVVESPK
jgi:hypothetical protein